MRPLKAILLMILGIIFYPLIATYIALENIGVMDKLREYNWTAIITYASIGFVAFLWVKYILYPFYKLI